MADLPDMSTIASVGGGLERVRDLLATLSRQHLDLDGNRRESRCALQAPVTLGVLASAGTNYKPLYRAWGTDLSRYGMGLLIEPPLAMGLEMLLNLEALVQRRCLLPVRVAYCQRLLPHTHRVGVAFVEG